MSTSSSSTILPQLECILEDSNLLKSYYPKYAFQHLQKHEKFDPHSIIEPAIFERRRISINLVHI
jgi:hypothetical protein